MRIIGLARNLNLIYGLQQVAGKILSGLELRRSKSPLLAKCARNGHPAPVCCWLMRGSIGEGDFSVKVGGKYPMGTRSTILADAPSRQPWLPKWLAFLSGVPEERRKRTAIVAVQAYVDESEGGGGKPPLFVFS